MIHQQACGVEAQDMVEPAERQPAADAHAQLHDLHLAVVRGHSSPELVVKTVVIQGVPLGVLGGQPGAVVEGIGCAPVGYRENFEAAIPIPGTSSPHT
jgi:hypothetical protein